MELLLTTNLSMVPLIEASAKYYSNTTWFELAQLVLWYGQEDKNDKIVSSKVNFQLLNAAAGEKGALREELRRLVPLQDRTMAKYSREGAMWRPPKVAVDGRVNFFFPMAVDTFSQVANEWRRQNLSYAQMNRSLQILTYFCCNCLRHHRDGFCHSVRQMRMELGNIRASDFYFTLNYILFGLDLMRTTMRGFKWEGGESASSRYILNRKTVAAEYRQLFFADTWGYETDVDLMKGTY